MDPGEAPFRAIRQYTIRGPPLPAALSPGGSVPRSGPGPGQLGGPPRVGQRPAAAAPRSQRSSASSGRRRPRERRRGGEGGAQAAEDRPPAARGARRGPPRALPPAHHRQPGAVVVRLRRREARLPEELVVAVDERELVGAVRSGRAPRAPAPPGAVEQAGRHRRRHLPAGGLHQGGPQARGGRPRRSRGSAIRSREPRGSLTANGTSRSWRPRLPPFRICPFSPSSSPWVEVTTSSVRSHCAARPQGLEQPAQPVVGPGDVEPVHRPEDAPQRRRRAGLAGSK